MERYGGFHDTAVPCFIKIPSAISGPENLQYQTAPKGFVTNLVV